MVMGMHGRVNVCMQEVVCVCVFVCVHVHAYTLVFLQQLTHGNEQAIKRKKKHQWYFFCPSQGDCEDNCHIQLYQVHINIHLFKNYISPFPI